MKNDRGITLIALVITIIVLLILAAISIATLTGENGILTKASEAERTADIEDTKEQIKLEIMGAFDEQGNSYTNQDLIDAVKKITGKEIAENTEIIQSQKGNDVDISDLWLAKERMITFSVSSNVTEETYEYTVPAESIWTEEFWDGLEPSMLNFGYSGTTSTFGKTNFNVTFPGGGAGVLMLDGEIVRPGDLVKDGGQYLLNDG